MCGGGAIGGGAIMLILRCFVSASRCTRCWTDVCPMSGNDAVLPRWASVAPRSSERFARRCLEPGELDVGGVDSS
jgi:hypothetical protein